ncbi:MAG: hypothetical protein HWN68_20115 [Desulfobacterales bacterium]|nr:hypothetical protein [Desulfobacterales bacterium]
MARRIYISQFETPIAKYGTMEFRCKCGEKSVLGRDVRGWYVTSKGKVTIKPSKKGEGADVY